MNKKGNIIIGAVVFLALWLISWLIWSIWTDGIVPAVLGCVTALAFLGVVKVVIKWP